MCVAAVFLRRKHFNVLFVIELSGFELNYVGTEFFSNLSDFVFVIFGVFKKQTLQFHERQMRFILDFSLLNRLYSVEYFLKVAVSAVCFV